MSIVRFEFGPYVSSDDIEAKYPTGNADLDNDVWGMLETYQAEEENGREQLTRLLLTNFRLVDYQLDQTNGTFSILATPDHTILPQELATELHKILYSQPSIDLSDHPGVIIPQLNNVYILVEQQVDLDQYLTV